MRIGCDVDGVIYDWVGCARFLLQHYRGIDVGENKTWSHIKDSISNNDWQWLWSAGVTKYGLFRHGNCYKGTFEALRKFAADGHQLVIITSRPKVAVEDTLAWLSYHRIQASEVHVLGPTVSKATVPRCDVALDDKPENVRDFISTGATGLLWDRPWNQGAEGLIRVSNWDEVEDYVDAVSVVAEVGQALSKITERYL